MYSNYINGTTYYNWCSDIVKAELLFQVGIAKDLR